MKTHNWSTRKGLRRRWQRKCAAQRASTSNFVLRGEQLEDRSLLAGDTVAAFAFTLTDSNGAALTSPAKVGDTVYLKATVQDVRSASVFDALLAEIQAANPGDTRTANDLKGFFQAYLNLDFDESVLTSINTNVSQFTFGTGVSSTSAFSLESADKSGVVDNVNGRLVNFGDVATNFGNTPNQNGNVLPFFTAPFRVNRVPLVGVNDTASVNQGSAVEIAVLANDSVGGSASFTGSPADLSNFFSGQAAVIFRGGDDPNTRSSIMPLANSAQYSFSNTSLSVTGRKEIVPNSITGLPAGATAVIREANGANSDGNPTNNVIFFTPAANSSGTQTFSYKLRNADDPNGPTQTRTVTVTVRPVNQTPSFSTSTAASQTINANTGSQSNQVINLTNISAGVNETQGLRFVVTSNNTSLLPNNSFTSDINASAGTGTISFKTALNISGNVTVSVQLFDDGFDGVIGVNPATGINDDAQSTVRQFSYVVNAVNGAPQFVTTSDALSFTEGDAAKQIDPGLVVTDSNGITGGRVTISGGLPEDELAFNVALVPGGKPAQISVTKDSSGSMIVSGNGTASEYQRVFRGITYRNLSGTPSTAQRTVTFSATDNGSPPATGTGTRAINVAAFNNAPTLGPASAVSAEFNVGGPSIAIASGLTLTDDGPSLKSASVRITSGLQPNLDQLTFVAQAGITGNYDASTGILNFTNTNSGSPASVEAYLNTLKSVRFSNSSANPGSATRTVLISVDDGSLTNATAQVTRGINIRTNAAPSLRAKTTAPLRYTEQKPAIAVGGNLLLTDDGTTLQSVTVRITDGFQAAFDKLTSAPNKTLDKLIATDSSIPGQLTFTNLNPSSPTTLKNFLTLLSAVKFSSASDDPGVTRTIVITVNDGSPTNAVAELARNIVITPVNDAPKLVSPTGPAVYGGLGSPVVVDGALVVTDPDNAQWTSAKVQITSGFKTAEDRLVFTASQNINGSFNAGVLTLTGLADVAEYQTVLRSVAYLNVAASPTTGVRGLTFTVNDGKLAASLKRTVEFKLATASTKGPTYTEQGAAVLVDGKLKISSAGGATLQSATVRIGDGFQPGLDTLSVPFNAVLDSFIATDISVPGQITFTSRNPSFPASTAQFATLLNSVRFSSTSDDPGTSRVIVFEINDGSSANATAELRRPLTIKPVNDAPALASTSSAVQFDSPNKPVVVDGAIAASDPDSRQWTGATIKITTGFKAAEDRLSFTPTPNIKGTFKSGLLTLTGKADVAEYQAALQSVTYTNIAANPAAGTRVIAFTAIDDGKLKFALNRTVTVNPGATPPPSTISGFVYFDGGQPGVKNATDLGVAGVFITLTKVTSPGEPAFTPVTVTTDQTGYYQFTGLSPGLYSISQTQPGSFIDGPETPGSALVTIPASSNDTFDVDLTGNGGQTLANNNFREAVDALMAGGWNGV